MKKTALLGLAIIALTSASLLKVADLYTKEQINTLAKSVSGERWWCGGLIEPVHLGDILYGNIHSVDSGNAGYATSDSYKNGWRRTLASNPQLGYLAIKLHGADFIMALNASLLKIHKRLCQPNADWRKSYYTQMSYPQAICEALENKHWLHGEDKIGDTIPKIILERRSFELKQAKIDSLENAQKISSFSLKKYWIEETVLFNRYQLLTQKLLSLNDESLNSLIRVMGEEQVSGIEDKDTIDMEYYSNWLYEQGLLKTDIISSYSQNDNDHGGWHMDKYPLDLLFLTYRVTRDYPDQWTARKFLSEVYTFSLEVEKILPKY